MPYKFQEQFEEAVRCLKIADHMTYVTLPLVNEKRLLIKIFDEIYKSILNCINAVLNYEFLYKRIKLYKSVEDNFSTFTEKCAKNYSLDNLQIKKIKKIFEINKQHKQSAMEFVKKDKVVILNDNLKTQILNLEIIKDYLLLAKEFVMKINTKFNLRD
jgi:hypothetical protein